MGMTISRCRQRPLRLVKDEAGQALVEAIIVVCVLAGLLATVVLFGRIGTAHQQVCFSARRAAFGAEPNARQVVVLPTPLPPDPREYQDGNCIVDVQETWAGDCTGDDMAKQFFNETDKNREKSGVVFQHINASVMRDGYFLTRKDRIVNAWSPLAGRTLSGDRGFLGRLTVTPKSQYEVACDPWNLNPLSTVLVTGIYAGCGLYSCWKDTPLESADGFFNMCLVLEIPDLNLKDLQDRVQAKIKEIEQQLINELVSTPVERIRDIPIVGPLLEPPIKDWLSPYIDTLSQTLSKILPP